MLMYTFTREFKRIVCEDGMANEVKSIIESGLPITIDPEILGGTPVFRGTRVPVKTLFDYIRWGYSLEEFLEYFPSVTRETVLQMLSAVEQMALEKAVA